MRQQFHRILSVSASKSRRGSIALAFLFLSSLTVLLGTSFVLTGMSETRMQTISTGGVIALNAADAGVAQAIRELNYGGGDFTTAEGWGPAVASDASFCGASTCRRMVYAVPAANNLAGASVSTATIVVRGTTNGDANTAVKVDGRANGSNVTTQVSVELQWGKYPNPFTGLFVTQYGNIFNTAATHIDNLFPGWNGINETIVDGYSSVQGAYGGANSGRDAGLGTTNVMGFDLQGPGVTVKGDIFKYNSALLPADVSISGSPNWSGVPRKGGSRPLLPNVTWPSSCANPSLPAGCTLITSWWEGATLRTGNKLKVNTGSTCNLTPGTYCFDGVEVYGNLLPAGPVDIYTTRQVTVWPLNPATDPSPQLIAYNDVPSNLRVYSNLDLSSQRAFLFSFSTVKGIFYHDISPFTDNSFIRNTKFFGSMIDHTVLVSSSEIHYDEALAYLTGLPAWLSGINGGPTRFVTVKPHTWSRQKPSP